MKYDLVLYRIDTKEKDLSDTSKGYVKSDEDHSVFTEEQRDFLKRKMRKFKYVLDGTDGDKQSFTHKNDRFGGATMYPSKVIFHIPWNMNSIFEVGFFISELVDTNDYAKYDPQQEEWDEVDLDNVQ